MNCKLEMKENKLHSYYFVEICEFIKDGSEGCCGRDRMVVGFTTTCAISAYHH